MMKQVFILVVLPFAGLCANAQLVPVDSVAAYIGKSVTVFGKVRDATFSATKEHDTTYLKLADNFTNQQVTLVIYPDSREGFGYRPEVVLLNKTIYVTGLLESIEGSYYLEVKTPFDIAFSPAKFAGKEQVFEMDKKAESERAAKGVGKTILEQRNTSGNKVAQSVAMANAQIDKFVDSLEQAQKQIVFGALAKNKAPTDSQPVVQETIAPVMANAQKNEAFVLSKIAKDTIGKKQQQFYPDTVAVSASAENEPRDQGEARIKTNVSIKAGPGKYFAVYGYLKKGDLVNVLLRHAEWSKIAAKQLPGGKVIQGFIKSDELE